MEEMGKLSEGQGYEKLDKVIQTCEAKSNPPKCKDSDGYMPSSLATKDDTAAKSLEKGNLTDTKAIILHRTAGASKESALSSFSSKGVGTHFLIAKNGTIFQTASLNKYTYHIGKIKSRCMQEKNCTEADSKAIKAIGWNPSKLHAHEKKKKYPDRYPVNSESIGIEVVARYNEKTATWDEPTPEKKKAIESLVNRLKNCYVLGDEDIYEHDKISYKKPGEGSGLYGN